VNATDVSTPVLAARLMGAIQRVRRTTRRAVRRAFPAPPLPSNQVELLLAVAEAPGIGVSDAAGALGLAANTVSTLVGQLEAAGLLQRQRVGPDRRAVQLTLSDAAADRLAAWRRRRTDLVAAALTELSDADRERLAAAVPALERLADAMARR
jgi:DNA-binding MarR family transcriptional regulator